MVPSYLLGVKENETILDMCAAPGGKTFQASFNLHDTGLIISNDLSKVRTTSILENVERLGLGNIVITNNDLSKIYDKLLNRFDRIILDAPCSGSGMFRKDSKMKDDWSYNKVLKYAETQKELLDIAYQMLKPGGVIAYSTCSYSQEEDEDVIENLLDKTDAELIKIDANELYFVNKNKPYGIHLLPHLFPGEGHYICLVKKPGNCIFCKEKERVNSNKYGLDFKNIYNFGAFIFGTNFNYNFKCFNIIRMGVKIGELIHDEIRYDYHYSHYVKNMPNIELNDEQLKLYFNGSTLDANLNKGYYLLKYKGINIDIAKCDGRLIKNHLPKPLRGKI